MVVDVKFDTSIILLVVVLLESHGNILPFMVIMTPCMTAANKTPNISLTIPLIGKILRKNFFELGSKQYHLRKLVAESLSF